MSPPQTRYAKSGEVSIAYQVSGSGPMDLIFVPGFVSNLDVQWETPGYSEFFARLGRFSRLIRFDKRGTGLSDRMVGISNLDERMDDVRAVMDATGSRRAALFGVSEGGPMSLLFAATYPERARALVLYGSYARHPTLTNKEFLQRSLQEIESLWGTGQFLARNMFPSKAADEALVRRAAQWERQSASPSAVAAVLRMNSEIDARGILPAVRTPTLVLHRIGDSRMPYEAGQFVAEHVPGARLLTLPGNDHAFINDPELVNSIADETEEFLTGSRQDFDADRVLATVMFTDIVDSTRRAAELGDRQWRGLVEQHDAVVRTQLARFRGRETSRRSSGSVKARPKASATFDISSHTMG